MGISIPPTPEIATDAISMLGKLAQDRAARQAVRATLAFDPFTTLKVTLEDVPRSGGGAGSSSTSTLRDAPNITTTTSLSNPAATTSTTATTSVLSKTEEKVATLRSRRNEIYASTAANYGPHNRGTRVILFDIERSLAFAEGAVMDEDVGGGGGAGGGGGGDGDEFALQKKRMKREKEEKEKVRSLCVDVCVCVWGEVSE